MSSHGSTKIVWNNQFQTPRPSASQLRDGYQKPLHSVFEAAREAFLDLDGVSESVAWHGVPWRWTLVYQVSEDALPRGVVTPVTRAFAYVIPDPMKLQVCIPLTREQILLMPMGRFKKHVRDTIVFARTVAGVSWPTWEVPVKSSLEDLEDLIELKRRALFSGVGKFSVQASA